MKVLVVSQSYPPYPQVGGLRAKKIAEMFRDRGHFVTVVTERLEGEQGDVRVRDGRLLVRTVHAGLPYRLRLVALRNRLQGRSVALSSWDGVGGGLLESEIGESLGSMRKGARAIGRLIIGLLRLPDDQHQFVPPAYRLCREEAEAGVDMVYTTAPAFSTHLVGLLLHLRGVRWVAEFRDPWIVENQTHQGKMPSLARVNQWMERLCLKHADAVVAVTDSVGRQLAAKLPVSERGKVIVAMNGIDELQPVRGVADHQKLFRIVYAGSFYHDRDPRPFLEALSTWMRKRGFGPEEVQVDFAGRCRHYANISVEKIVTDLELSEMVGFSDWLSPGEIQTMLIRADLLLLLARSQPAQIPNKLFDYLGVRTPILAVVDAGGESDKILSEVGGQFVLTAPEGENVTATAILDALESAYRQRSQPCATNESALDDLLVRRQFGHLGAALGA